MTKTLDKQVDKIGLQKLVAYYLLMGLGIWTAQDVGDIGMFISQFKQQLTDCITKRWHTDITESSRCDTY